MGDWGRKKTEFITAPIDDLVGDVKDLTKLGKKDKKKDAKKEVNEGKREVRK